MKNIKIVAALLLFAMVLPGVCRSFDDVADFNQRLSTFASQHHSPGIERDDTAWLFDNSAYSFYMWRYGYMSYFSRYSYDGPEMRNYRSSRGLNAPSNSGSHPSSSEVRSQYGANKPWNG